MKPDKLGTFARITSRKYANQFRKKGLLFLNTLSYFRGIEEKNLRGDENEGLSKTFQPGQAKLLVDIDGEKVELSEETGLIGPIKLTFDDDLESTKIFCLYTFTHRGQYLKLDPKMLEFGDCAVAITNPRRFMHRVKIAAQNAQIDMMPDLVKYVDLEKHHGEVGPFRKDRKYANQEEFRIAVKKGEPGPYILKIGSIEDISIFVNAEKLEAVLNRMAEISWGKYKE